MNEVSQDHSVAPDGHRLRGWITGHQIISFFVLAYATSWTLWGAAAIGGGQVVFLMGGLGPLASALIVTRLSGRSVLGWLRSLLVWRVNPGYFAIALLLPATIYLVINLVLVALGQRLDFSLLVTTAPAYLGTFLMVATVGGGFEEPGWRGFALPQLQERRSPLVATLLLGLAWGIWHIPLYGPVGFVVPLILAFFYSWLYNRTGSVLLCLLLHASFTPRAELPDHRCRSCRVRFGCRVSRRVNGPSDPRGLLGRRARAYTRHAGSTRIRTHHPTELIDQDQSHRNCLCRGI